MASRNDDNIVHTGTNTFTGTVTLPSSCVANSQVSASAAIDPSKIVQQHKQTYGQSGTMTTVTIPINIASGSGTLKSIEAGSITACTGDATCTVDLKKNGSSVLTAVITLDSANSARVAEAGTINTSAIADGDFFELVVTATAGTGALGTGLGVSIVWNENPVV